MMHLFKKNWEYAALLGVLNAVPFATYAVIPPQLQNILDKTGVIINGLVGVVIALAGLMFLWGVFKFVSAAGDEKARDTGRQFIIWGLIGLTVMFVVWGLVKILVVFFVGDQGTIPELPLPPH